MANNEPSHTPVLVFIARVFMILLGVLLIWISFELHLDKQPAATSIFTFIPGIALLVGAIVWWLGGKPTQPK